MLDFWESMGRVVANENGLRKTLLSDPNLTSPNDAILCQPATGVSRRVAWSIPTTKYYELRSILNQHLHFLPASLTCLGEWLRVLPDASESDFSPLPGSTSVVLTGRSFLFYAALGSITLDDSFAAEFRNDPGTYFPLSRDLSQQDINDLRSLAGDTRSGGFSDTALKVCAKFWPPPCLAIVEPYSAELKQTHLSLDTGSHVTTRRTGKETNRR